MSSRKEIAVVAPPDATKIPDNAQWTNRFEIRSSSSNRLYTVAQNKKTGGWACSCLGYIRYRRCKHLIDGFGLSLEQIHGNNQLPPKSTQKEVADGTQAKRSNGNKKA